MKITIPVKPTKATPHVQDKFAWEQLDRPAYQPPTPEQAAIALRADRLCETVLGAGVVFPCDGAPLRAVYNAAKGDVEVRRFIRETTWAGRWAAMVKEEGNG